VNWLIQSRVTGEFLAQDPYLFATPFAAFAKKHVEEDAIDITEHNPRLRMVCAEVVEFYSPEPPEAMLLAA
jgi:hypothetical protein